MTAARVAVPGARRRMVRRARLVTIVWLLSTAVSILVLPLVGVGVEASPMLRTLGALGMAAFFLATVAVLWSAVTPWSSAVVNSRTTIGFAVSAVISVPLVSPVAAGDWPTWAWLGATITGIAPLLWRWDRALGASVVATMTSAAVATATGGSVLDHLIITGGMGAGLAVINWAPVWLLDLLVRAEASQDSLADLTAAEERLRFAGDVHDVLGHDLTVIALKSELATRTARTDPETAARESAEVRRLAETALERVRSTAAGYQQVDLPAELAQIASLLGTAGVRCDVDMAPVELAPAAAGAMSAVAKEATTNVLRHSSARSCRITLTEEGGLVALTVANDGVRPHQPHSGPSGLGLSGMSWRLAPFKGKVRAHRTRDVFTVRAEVPTRS